MARSPIIRPTEAQTVDGLLVLTERDGRTTPIKAADALGAQFLAAAHRLEINRIRRRPAR